MIEEQEQLYLDELQAHEHYVASFPSHNAENDECECYNCCCINAENEAAAEAEYRYMRYGVA